MAAKLAFDKLKVPYYPLKTIIAPYQDELKKACGEVIDSGQFLNGHQLEKFEAKLCSLLKSPYTCGTSSGLSALETAFEITKPNFDDCQTKPRIIIQNNTFIATALAALQKGYEVILVDTDHDHFWAPSESSIKESLKYSPTHICPVSLYGIPIDYGFISAFSIENNLTVIEDAAQSFLTQVNGQLGGTNVNGWITAYSLYPGKTLGCLGDGGFLTLSRLRDYEMAKKYINYGSSIKYIHEFVGTNSRLSEIQAAVSLIRLFYIKDEILSKQCIADLYFKGFKDFHHLMPKTNIHECSWHIFPLRLPNNIDRNEFQRYLKTKGIDTSVHYPLPLSEQPAIVNTAEWLNKSDSFKNSCATAKKLISLPIWPYMPKPMVEYVIECCITFFHSHG